jgi:hypothetical protein
VLCCVLLFGCLGNPFSNPTLTPAFTESPSSTFRPARTSTASPTSTPTQMRNGPTATPLLTATEGPPPSATPLPPPVYKPRYGVQVHFFAGDLGTIISWIDGLGVGWVKQQVEWHTIEVRPGEYDWEPLDHVVDSCEAMGFKLLLSVVRAPDWLRADALESGPPQDFVQYGRFMEELSARYKGRVAAYELWNEPNLAREWRGDTLDPARFVALVAEGSKAVRAADPGALIVSGAPAVTGINDGVTAIDDRIFLQGMYEAGIAQWVDGIGAHPYGFANPPGESWQDPTHVSSSHNDHPSFFFLDTLEDYHAIMLEYGDVTQKLWVTEFGWPSVENMGDMDTTGWEYARAVSEAQQAEYIVEAFHIGDERPWVGPMFLWNLNLATIWGSGNPVSAYSLLRPDESFRPAYWGLRWTEPLGE